MTGGGLGLALRSFPSLLPFTLTLMMMLMLAVVVMEGAQVIDGKQWMPSLTLFLQAYMIYIVPRINNIEKYRINNKKYRGSLHKDAAKYLF